MHLRIGFDIELTLSSPTALIYMLQVHPSRAGDVVGDENITISPPLATDFYRDAFDNECARVRVPAGVERVLPSAGEGSGSGSCRARVPVHDPLPGGVPSLAGQPYGRPRAVGAAIGRSP